MGLARAVCRRDVRLDQAGDGASGGHRRADPRYGARYSDLLRCTVGSLDLGPTGAQAGRERRRRARQAPHGARAPPRAGVVMVLRRWMDVREELCAELEGSVPRALLLTVHHTHDNGITVASGLPITKQGLVLSWRRFVQRTNARYGGCGRPAHALRAGPARLARGGRRRERAARERRGGLGRLVAQLLEHRDLQTGGGFEARVQGVPGRPHRWRDEVGPPSTRADVTVAVSATSKATRSGERPAGRPRRRRSCASAWGWQSPGWRGPRRGS
ncbi:hypothetical protein NKG05_28320 [Oerskovia sp. M15]